MADSKTFTGGCHCGQVRFECTSDLAMVTAKSHASFAARNAESFMDPRVIVKIVVDTVPPRIAPAVGVEQLLEQGCGIIRLSEINGTGIADKREPRIVRRDSVIRKEDGLRFAGTNHSFKRRHTGCIAF